MNTVTPAGLARLLLDAPSTKVYDVREPDEFAHTHLAASINLPLLLILAREFPPRRDPDRRETFVVLCQSGKRSGVVAEMLRNAGYEGVTLPLGGLNAWIACGYPVRSGLSMRVNPR